MSNNPQRDAIRRELLEIEKKLSDLQLKKQDYDLPKLTSLIEEQSYIEAYESSYQFLQHSWSTFEPSEFLPAKHLHAIGEHLDACLSGQIKKLIINLPPRFSKSSLVSKAFPAYCWVKEPGKRIINVSYSKKLAVGDSLVSRQIIESDWYQRGLNTVWKELNNWRSIWELSKDQNTKEDYRNTWDGRRFATSTGSSTLTGVGGDIIIIDDPLNPGMAHSKIERDNCNEWSAQTLSSRLDNKKEGITILVMQRLHENELTGYFLEQGIWEHLFLPNEWEESRRFWTSIGWTDWRTKENELLDPVRHDRGVTEQLKLQMGEYGYAGQYQQNPVPLGGGLIKQEWWKTWFVLPNYFDSACIAMDLSIKDGKDNDNTALVAIGKRDNKFYIIDVAYGKMDIVKQVETIINFCEKHNWIRAKLIEDAANGSPVSRMLDNRITGLIKVASKGVPKDVRIMAMIPEINAGNVLIPDPKIHSWIQPLLTEANMFPKGKHDDLLDALQYSLDYLLEHNTYCRMPVDIITESANTVSRSNIRELIPLTDRYNNPVNISREYMRGLFE